MYEVVKWGDIFSKIQEFSIVYAVRTLVQKCMTPVTLTPMKPDMSVSSMTSTTATAALNALSKTRGWKFCWNRESTSLLIVCRLRAPFEHTLAVTVFI